MKLMNFFKKEDPEIASKIKAATSIRMDEEAREKTRALLAEYMKMRPIRAVEPAPKTVPAYEGVLSFFTRHSMPVTAMALVLTIGGSTVAAAESALPGETLYSIKVHVTEEVRATLALSPKAKADWEMSRAERRLEEAAILSLIGELDDAARAEIDTNLDAHVKSAGESRQKLEREDKVSDASRVEENINAVLVARENILDGKLAAKAAARADAAALTMSVRSAAPEAALVADANGTDESESVKKGHRTAAKVRIEATKKFLDRSPNQLGTTTRKQAETRLKDAEDSLSSGDAEETHGDKERASSNFDSALEAATAIETLISVSHDTEKDLEEDKPDLVL